MLETALGEWGEFGEVLQNLGTDKSDLITMLEDRDKVAKKLDESGFQLLQPA